MSQYKHRKERNICVSGRGPAQQNAQVDFVDLTKCGFGLYKGLFLVFLVSCGGVRLSPLAASATTWPIAPSPYDG
jgi:hypothetical protein